jgi:hypothetical protein
MSQTKRPQSEKYRVPVANEIGVSPEIDNSKNIC